MTTNATTKEFPLSKEQLETLDDLLCQHVGFIEIHRPNDDGSDEAAYISATDLPSLVADPDAFWTALKLKRTAKH